MKRVVLTAALAIASAWIFPAQACQSIDVDCKNHVIKIDNQVPQDNNGGKIDCGMSGHPTVNGTGKVGGLHHGPIVPNGVEIEGIPGMGESGGGKVFHTPNPRDESSMPRGNDSTKGCIAVSKMVLDQLRGACKGAKLTITGGGKGGEMNTGSTYRGPPSGGGFSTDAARGSR